jgi:hypothetical protein
VTGANIADDALDVLNASDIESHRLKEQQNSIPIYGYAYDGATTDDVLLHRINTKLDLTQILRKFARRLHRSAVLPTMYVSLVGWFQGVNTVTVYGHLGWSLDYTVHRRPARMLGN